MLGAVDLGLACPGHAQCQCLGPQEREQRRQKPQRGQHDRQHRDGSRNGEAIEEVDAQDEEAEQRNDDGESGELHRTPGGADGLVGSTGLVVAGEECLPIPVEHEQCVVDTHAKADHRGQRGREGRHVEESRHEENEHLAHRETQQRDDDRHTCGDNRAKGDEQDDDGDEDADRLARRRCGVGELQDLPTRPYSKLRRVSRLDGGHDRLGVIAGDLRTIAAEAHGRERNRTVCADRRGRLGGRLKRRAELLGEEVREWLVAPGVGAVAAIGIAVGVGHAGHGLQRSDLLEHGRDLFGHDRIGDAAACRRPHDPYGSLT